MKKLLTTLLSLYAVTAAWFVAATPNDINPSLILSTDGVQQKIILPGEEGRKPAAKLDYFPHNQYAFVWRNWSVVNKSRLAEVLQTSVQNVEQLAASMGLPRKQTIEPEWSTTRGYITILKRNWHLLPYEQLLQLLGMSREELKFRLIEDDFLYIKLGSIKPYCESLLYTEPTAEMRERAAEIATVVRSLGKDALKVEEPRFGFMHDFEKLQLPANNKKGASIDNVDTATDNNEAFELRMIFPYFSDFGDPLLDEKMSSYPEELFRQLQEVGVNGVWLHSVMRMMVEPDNQNGFPGDKKAMERIKGLKRLVDRAAKYGIKIYLYVNEPRAMDEDYFDASPKHKEYMGPEWGGLNAFCTSNPKVLNWLSSSMESIFSQVEGLGGVFTITASENYTSCVSRNHLNCPHCKDKAYADLIAEINCAIEKGVHKAAPDAKVIVWDWGWRDNECEAIINKLPKECWFMSVSEWSKPFERGGVKSVVGEYSISNVGPGPRALRNWAAARKAGLKCVAKVQVNCTWEMATVPQIPVLDLVAQHAQNLTQESVNGVMLSWSLGGCPSENLKLFQSFRKGADASKTVDQFALNEYGSKAGPLVREAWRACSNGFTNYPYHININYYGPQHKGPANPFYTTPTNYGSTMVYGFPYDHWQGWHAVYPYDVWLDLMNKSAKGFADGVKLLEQAYDLADKEYRQGVKTQLSRAETVRIHLQSSVEQGRFFEARDRYLKSNDASEKAKCKAIMRKACITEQALIREMLPVLSADSQIAFESANQYFYITADLVEAYISIDYALRWIDNLK